MNWFVFPLLFYVYIPSNLPNEEKTRLIETVDLAIMRVNHELREDMVFFCIRNNISKEYVPTNPGQNDIYFLKDSLMNTIVTNIWPDERFSEILGIAFYKRRKDIYIRFIDEHNKSQFKAFTWENKETYTFKPSKSIIKREKELDKLVYSTIIAHEILHLFGFDHRSNTITRARIGRPPLGYYYMEEFFIHEGDFKKWEKSFYYRTKDQMDSVRLLQDEYYKKQSDNCGTEFRKMFI